MKKEEKIKEAWGKLMPDYTNIDLNSGWSLNDFYEEDFNDIDFHTMQIYTPCKIRPKSLQGIENNNGWIKIESEDDLPKEELDVHFIFTEFKEKEGRFQTFGVWDNKLKSFYSGALKINTVTHYQPIHKPKPPIY